MGNTSADQNVLLTPSEQESVAKYISSLGGSSVDFQTTSGSTLPNKLNEIFQKVLHAIELDLPISISTMPKEVTTTTAASLLGIARPTLMKHVREGRINAHKVGSHHRLFSNEVLKFREELKQQKRDAVFELLDFEQQLEESDQ